MRTTIIILLLLVPAHLFAQSKSVHDFQSKYENDRDATVIQFNGPLFELMFKLGEAAEEDDDELKSFGKVAGGVKSVKIVSVPTDKIGIPQSELVQLKKNVISENYDELFSARDGGETINFYSQEAENVIKNVVMMVYEDDKFTVVNVNGEMSLKDMAILAKHLRHFR